MADVVRLVRAAHREHEGDKFAALDVISKARFRTRYGQIWGDLYRAKLLILANQPRWHVTVADIAMSVGDPQDVRYAGYFGWYAQYMLALSTCNEALEVEAVKQLGGQGANRLIRRTLPYFQAPLAKG